MNTRKIMNPSSIGIIGLIFFSIVLLSAHRAIKSPSSDQRGMTAVLTDTTEPDTTVSDPDLMLNITSFDAALGDTTEKDTSSCQIGNFDLLSLCISAQDDTTTTDTNNVFLSKMLALVDEEIILGAKSDSTADTTSVSTKLTLLNFKI